MSIVITLRYSWRGWRANVHYADSSGLTDSLENYLKQMDLKKLPADTRVNVFELVGDKSKLEQTVECLLKASQRKLFLNSVLPVLPAILVSVLAEKYGGFIGPIAGMSLYIAMAAYLDRRADSRLAKLDLKVPKENIFLLRG